MTGWLVVGGLESQVRRLPAMRRELRKALWEGGGARQLAMKPSLLSDGDETSEWQVSAPSPLPLFPASREPWEERLLKSSQISE